MARLRAINDNILCINGDFGDQTTESGLIIKSTIGKSEGITPRWFQVLEVGPKISWLKEGQWVYVEYGRWTEGFKANDERLEPDQKVWKVEPKACMIVSDEEPDGTLNITDSTVSAMKKTRD